MTLSLFKQQEEPHFVATTSKRASRRFLRSGRPSSKASDRARRRGNDDSIRTISHSGYSVHIVVQNKELPTCAGWTGRTPVSTDRPLCTPGCLHRLCRGGCGPHPPRPDTLL